MRHLRIEQLESRTLLAVGLCEYVVITTSDLVTNFESLVEQKEADGLTAEIVTIEHIEAEYTGSESGDMADQIRGFIADAYENRGTRWVLLGGDSEIIPPRLVYGSATTYETLIATDLYYACLDGPWDGDDDGLWGECNDGIGGNDIDLIAEVFVGRAPVSNAGEADNFVNKTIWYSTRSHNNHDSVTLLGSRLDSLTSGSYSSEAIREQVLPDDWRYTELYDSVATWTGADLVAQLNAGTHFVHHLGHSGSMYNAKLSRYNVDALTNVDPYIMCSQGCWAGAFDLADVAIAEAHVVAEHGAVAVIMNSRLGWYAPGLNLAGNHYYAIEFFDAIFTEGKATLGEAHWDSRLDNLGRVQATGVYRWINFEINLLGDPALLLDPPTILVPPDVTVEVELVGNVLTINMLDSGFGVFFVEVGVSDGRLVDTEMFRVQEL